MNPFHVYSVDEYIELIIHYREFAQRFGIGKIPSVSRPLDLLIKPKWGLKIINSNKADQSDERKGAFQGKSAEGLTI